MADTLFLADELAAWERYMADTCGVSVDRYEEVEPWAWKRLQQELKAARYRLQGRLAPAA